ncbi:hypothetical protein AUK41_00745 [Candidatus Berkelbacteria bacterium CG2_30_43_20]|uniref:SpoVT-AbrB domain-containing protein n=1 Tax=Candidatus Berkelbacteria bacterium CG10_big_fil_rev_8_21_14_0_10_43_14 TaxID=1974515 RepID=A0A2M6R9Z8_9BACT|nr:MAG: hypothetical protein AUK41_00745 [Candidatus Berkelbacteria bacterium CG2_30_43_20]PIS06821.1 MAG: hypothetical protein COT79_02635 [Candidatus Berkelbacteria bacterium CG10_big_fil_rev_8_21_14_0_10_43_14]
MKRHLIKFSNYSFCITLPKKAIDALGWKKGEELEVEFDARKKRISVVKGESDSATKTTKPSADIKPIPKLRW